MKKTVCGFLYLSVMCTCASVLLEESFENVTVGSIAGQNSWTVEHGLGSVQTNEVFNGSQALQVQNGAVSHSLTNHESALWTRFQVFVTGAPEVNPVVAAENAGVAFFVSTNLMLAVYSNTVPVELEVPVATQVWTRFDVYCDYDSMSWNLSMDGTTVAAGLPLSAGSADIEQVQFSNDNPDSVFVDDIDIRNHELAFDAPDIDGNGMPDWWEQQYFGLITGNDAHAMSGNPGWTYLETYIAGISPVSAEPFEIIRTGSRSLSWDAKPARVYDVLWTTNLLSGFMPVASNLVAESEFSDTSSNTNLPSGFYQVQVRLEP
ncbi:hypothetical protein PDESU_02201 [Pontiella desulfatans]|uniref:Uncharacterized protein n=2 Tax=Pontiella desulfatans TaxID=2750659 RepID=A0A6C2U1W5_PONDE|nr:hypothetical protein PDESU_02201 [Pontiella desulfatans]